MTHRLTRHGVLAVAAAFIGYWALLVYCDVWRPSPLGLDVAVDSHSLVVTNALPAYNAGLRTGDRLISVDGQPMAGRLAWLAMYVNLEIGRPTTWLVAREATLLSIDVTPTLSTWRTWRSQRGVELLLIRCMQLVTLLLAVVVAIRRPSDPTALVGAAFLANIGVISVTLPNQLASVWRDLPWAVAILLSIPFLSSVTIAAWGFSFFAVFPRVRYRTRAAWCVAWIPVVPGLVWYAIFGYHAVVLGRPSPPFPPWAEGMVVVVGAAYVCAGVAVLALTYRRVTDVNERRRIRVLMVGSIMGGVSGTLVLLSYWGTSAGMLGQSFLASPAATLGTFLFLAMPFSFAYAIMRHRLFDVGVMIRQGVRYALARRALLALVPVLLLVLGVDLLLHGDQPVADVLRSHVWMYLGLSGLAVLIRMRRQRWLEALDRRFFRDRYNAQRLLRQVAEDVRHSATLAAAAPALVARIEQALHATFAAVLMREGSSQSYRTLAASPPTHVLTSLAVDNKVLALARLVAKPVEIGGSGSGWLSGKMPAEDVNSIHAAGIELVVAVRSAEGDAAALLVLGSKRSEEPYTDDDGELLMAIAESIAERLPAAAAEPGAAKRFEECPSCGTCYDTGVGLCETDGAVLATVAAPRLLAGRYLIERRLGRGGMGAVYAAFDTSLSRRVAAKLVGLGIAGSAGASERFQREARVAAAFSHPNVVTVHDFGAAGTYAFLVMELLDAGTLRDTLRAEERLESRRALAILRDVAAAVEAAHRRQIVHRDLKPENVCLVTGESGEHAKVLDFGIAKLFAARDSESLTTELTGGAILGTPLYMAPEQLRGEDADPSWDLWALAVVAFELLAGSHPFATSAFVRDGGVLETAIDARLAHVPPACREFFGRALAVDRAARPRTAADFIAGLEQSLCA